ncbi:hypothetical protein [Streptomonospora litoralis]|uniref:Uncharacterized protein n=1 Tax=Streptomonospora litoralis TaxID=2498135 RepID=A0A4P6Q3U7_9ACTN|nr:hypothetical protein [Streptomonospora litoralis]QBI53961.1 hypothetical protein EKD16_10875 [Streptomonospora litoralis]
MGRVDPEKRRAATARLRQLAEAGQLTARHVRLTGAGCGVSERTVWRWIGPDAPSATAETVIDLLGRIGDRVLDNLLPARRLRISPRAVKRPLSRYAYKSLRVDRRSYRATVQIAILTGSDTS